jgi:hypothetical protein
VDVEDLVHPDQLEQRAHRPGHLAQLQVAPLAVQLTQARQDRAQPRTVDEAQLAEIEHDLAARLEQRRNVALEILGVAGVQLLAGQDHHRHVANRLRRHIHRAT